MNTRKACFVGLAAVATLLAGCVAQYRNPVACEDEMRSRLADDGSQGELSVTHSAVSYRGQRVVVEGRLEKARGEASGVAVASAASAVSAASDAQAFAPLGASSAVATAAAASGVAASGVAVAAAASGASGASAAHVQPKPTTPVAAIAQKLGLKPRQRTLTAAECTFNESGLVSFRWLAPAALAKTTPDPHAADE